MNEKQLEARRESDRNREKECDSIRLRMPKGSQDKITAYVSTLAYYQRRYGGKDVPNVNQWMCDVLLNALPDEYK